MNPTICSMKIRKLTAVACAALALLAAPAAWALGPTEDQTMPADVQQFLARRDLCDRYRFEKPDGAERRRQLEQRVRETCAGTDAKLAALRLKYMDRAPVAARLSVYDEEIEP